MRLVSTLLLLFGAFVCTYAEVEPGMSREEAMAALEAEDEEEEEFTGHGVFTDEELAEVEASEETFEFEAEVTRLMDIIINALYSNREVFLRELMSNSADALDKIRFMSLSETDVLGETEDLEIRVSFDKEKRTVTIRDTGVGMTKEELTKNLGVVAKSGTTEFVEAALSDQDALSLIGQFGVGFYSVYLVADRVTVASKHNDGDQYVWQSNADRTFTVAKDPRGNTLGRGTSVTLHLKDDSSEFLNQGELRTILERYSQFLNYPIYLETTKTVSEEVPVEEDEDEEEEEIVVNMDGDEDLLVEEEDEDEADAPPKTKTVRKEITEWERVNPTKALWTRSPKEITDEEYSEFYKSFTKDTRDPLDHIHFSAEGEISFRSLLFVGSHADQGLYDNYHAKANNNLKLFVRRVLISDEFDDFLPRYMNFVKGVVDSDDLPLQVSRENLAQSRVMKVMSKKLTRKVLEMLRKMAEAEEEAMEDEEDEDEDDEEVGVDFEEEEEVYTKYSDFWAQYGKSIKLGLIEDKSNKNKLSKLLRFRSNLSPDTPISLDRYVENMQDKQRHIYYISGASVEIVQKSPFLERVTELGYEVLFLIDSLDEYVTQHLTEYEGNSLMSITKEGLKLDGEEKKVKKYEEDFAGFTEWLAGLLGSRVEKVVVSPRLVSSPAIIVTSQYGWSANMERIMTAQTFADNGEGNQWMKAKKTLEINPRHSVIIALKARVENDAEDAGAIDIAELLYDTATIQSGFGLENIESFADRVHRIMGSDLSVDINELAPEKPDLEEDEEDEEGPDLDDILDEMGM
jgi:heat shock protein beta